MRQTIAKIDMGYAQRAWALGNKFHREYVEKHGMEYLQNHYEEYEAERGEYIKANI